MSPSSPSSGGANRLTLLELRALAASVGFVDSDLAAAVAMAESGGVVDAVGDNGTSFGLWQINLPSHPQYDPDRLRNEPEYNAHAALEISQGGKSWQPWTTYRNGQYLKHFGAT